MFNFKKNGKSYLLILLLFVLTLAYIINNKEHFYDISTEKSNQNINDIDLNKTKSVDECDINIINIMDPKVQRTFCETYIREVNKSPYDNIKFLCLEHCKKIIGK